MTGVATAIAVTGIGAALLSSSAQKSAVEGATAAEERGITQGIEEQRRQFDKIQELLQPFVSGGTQAFTAQGALTGLQGPETEQAAIEAIRSGPEFGALVETGEEAILQNQAAIGGLRGGNVRQQLAQFRPQILSQLINQRFNRLGTLSSQGQASAAGVGTAAFRTGADVAEGFRRGGETRATGALARGQIAGNLFGDVAGAFGTLLGNEQFTERVF